MNHQQESYRRVVERWKSLNIASVEQLDTHLDHFRILFAYHSGKIENEDITYQDTREIFQHGRVVGYTGNPRALFEQQNQKRCYELLKSKIIEKQPLTLSLIKDVHKVLTEGTYDEHRYIVNEERPGEFKKHDDVTGVHEVGSAAAEVEADVTELLAEVNAYRGEDVLKAAAYFHAVFEFIHPFADGNGRAGRTLTNYCLMLRGHPPFIVYDEDKQLYF